MAHARKRHLQASLEKLVKFSPLIGVLGHRQVGKTTLLEMFSSDYRSLDDFEELSGLLAHPSKYVAGLRASKTVIDESQLAPPLFSALKEHVRKNKKPGQFILSGSVRFTSKKAIRESLTGRIQYLELLPFTVSELESESLPSVVTELIELSSFRQIEDRISLANAKFKRKSKIIETYLLKGGLPGACFIREEKLRKSALAEQLKTILDRDLRSIYSTNLSYDQIFKYLVELAKIQGAPIRFQSLRRRTQLSPQTQQKLLYAFESVFLLRRISIEGGRNGFTVFLEDQGESGILSGNALSRGDELSQLLFRNIRAEFFYRIDREARFFQYRSRNGAVVPLVLELNDRYLGFLPIKDTVPSSGQVNTANSFLNKYSNSKLVFVHEGLEVHSVNDRLASLPIGALI